MNDKTQEEILTRKANLARERLLAVVDELDRKRHNIAHPIQLVSRKLPPPAAIAAIGAASLVAIGAIGFVIARLTAKARQPPPLRKRLQQQFKRQPPPPSFWADIGSRTAKALIAFTLIEVGKLVIRKASTAVAPPASSAGF